MNSFLKHSIPQRSLTDTQVRSIRIDLAQGNLGVELAVKYSVSPATISNIRTGKTYAEVTVEPDAS